MTRGQSAIEFMILVGAVLFFFGAFLFSLQNTIADKQSEQRDLAVYEVALTVQEEVALAHAARQGYERAFTLPQRVANADYEVSLVAGSVYVRTIDERHALALPVMNVTGDVHIGGNTIRTTSAGVFVN